VLLSVSSIPPEKKKKFPAYLYLLNTARAKAWQVALWEIPLSAEIQTPPEQLSPEHLSSKEQ
jgi:hypothetical protein